MTECNQVNPDKKPFGSVIEIQPAYQLSWGLRSVMLSNIWPRERSRSDREKASTSVSAWLLVVP